MRKISYYRSSRGDCPFELFLDACAPKVRNKMRKMLDVLSEKGQELRRPYVDFLRDGIWELRVPLAGDQYRAFYFFWESKDIVITHGIIKKSNEVPPAEIDRAIRYKTDFIRRKTLGQIEE